ncbi:putative Josephin-like protein [Hypsibius exemplaris]|uniref:ubiquitinyl hydrolase 1 n=1 Tax=Hypsibius exemplaris TaxID=2072580 RepID=A0A1W0WGT7_HYPEX|nr:putative Josephin-like protein [Hypsibius exemplaris]
MDSRSMPIYHEHQVKQFCALHALNNLFGESCFTKKSLDDICERLAPTKGWGNPHRSFFGFGNWDCECGDGVPSSRKLRSCLVGQEKVTIFQILDLKPIVGFILNIPNDYAIGSFKLPLGRRTGSVFAHRHIRLTRPPAPKQSQQFHVQSRLLRDS